MPDSQHASSPSSDSTVLPPAASSEAKGSNGLGLAALVVGILAFIGALIPFVNYGSGLLAVVGVVLGAIALTRKNRVRKAALSGVVISAIALVLSIILAIVYTAGFVTAVDDSLGTATSQSDAAATDDDDAAADTSDDATVGTRENPAALGTVVELATAGSVEYEVTLGASTLLANDVIAAENQFNEAAPEGFQFALVPVTMTYVGAETGTPWVDITVEYVSAAGTTHTSSDASVVGPASMMEINELYPDATGTGNVVIAIPTADAELGTWTVSTLFGDTYFYAAQ